MFNPEALVNIGTDAVSLANEIRAAVAPDGDGGKKLTKREIAALVPKVTKLLGDLTKALLS